ncbi:magnesium transporter [Pararhodobacter aggregans]|uniref:Magnesium transporter MgtE n=1 Tax=Pararhodobacter aggregans TaxID=404875 RepID=A0A2T7ULR4_9RHOB|nr:magnesium transporter [Pararhodobacter aggregans]PTX02183.1 magnesium transporter [Pararhodobacter aggregans]PVE45642.1 magnesium transporter [Pararhodobacter aggregans]
MTEPEHHKTGNPENPIPEPTPRPEPPEEDREVEELDAERIDTVLEAVDAGDARAVAAALDTLHPADISDLLEQISSQERKALLTLYPEGVDGDVLSELDEAVREEVIEAMPREALAEAVRELDTDDVVDILEDLEDHDQAFILDSLEKDDRAAVESSLAWPEYSAGRLMQSETVSVPQDWNVGQTIDHLRSADWLPDQFYHVILVDERHRPTGYATLGRVLASKRDTALSDIVEDSFMTVEATEEEAEVARMFNKYHLISTPVVDGAGRLVGVITIDDAMVVLDDEHEEDMLRMAGVGDESSLSDGVWETVRQRFPWLAVNLVTANIAAAVIGLFEGTIAVLVALAALMPIVASMGGNAGTQSLTVAVRALATKDLTESNAARVVRRELVVGLINGLGFAMVMGVVAWALYGRDVWLGAVIGAALIINLTVAALGGVLVPLALNRLKLDPALASGTFVTTLTDVVGFFVFLGLATLVLL